MNGASSRPLHRESPADGSLRGVSSRLPCEQTACSSLSSGEVRRSRSCVCFGGSVLHGREVCRFCGDLRRAIPFCGPIRLVCHWVVGEFGLAFASHMTYADLQSTGSAGERTGYACCLFQMFLIKKNVDNSEGDEACGFLPKHQASMHEALESAPRPWSCPISDHHGTISVFGTVWATDFGLHILRRRRPASERRARDATPAALRSSDCVRCPRAL